MSAPQRITLVAGMALVVSMTLFPPWVLIYSQPSEGPTGEAPWQQVSSGALRTTRPAGYRFLFGSYFPQDTKQLSDSYGFDRSDPALFAIVIDTTKLIVQILAGMLLTGTAFIFLTERRPEK